MKRRVTDLNAVEETLLRDIFIWYYYTMNEEGTQELTGEK